MSERAVDVSSTIGNLIRVALAVELEEAEAACVAASIEPLEILLLDPRLTPGTPADHLANRQLLQAFAHFRQELETIRKPLQSHDAVED